MISPYPTSSQLTEEQRALLARVRAGEPIEGIRNAFLLSENVQTPVERMAAYYLRLAQEWGDASVEGGDLVNEANNLMLSCFPRIMTKKDPLPWLLKIARHAMINYVAGRTTSERRQHEKLTRLDERLPGECGGMTLADTLIVETRLLSPEKEHLAELISQAIEALPEKPRMVIKRHYGIDQEPESLNAISRQLARKPAARTTPANAYYYHKQALAALRIALARQLPQYREGGVQ